MEFNVAQLLREPIGSRRDYHIQEPAPGGEAISGDLSLLRTDRGILARALLTAQVDAICSRCLIPTRAPVELDIEEEYYPTVDVHSGAPLPPPEDPTAFRLDAHHILDLSEAVRQHLVMAEPMQPLCSLECAGLCSQCGADLNQGACGCPNDEDLGPWSALRKLAGQDGAGDT